MSLMDDFQRATKRVSDVVREMIPRHRQSFTKAEMDLAVHLRTNEALFYDLCKVIESRITGRAVLPVPSNPTDCLASMARDHELRLLLSRLEALRRSPATPPAEDDGEQPA